MSSPTDLIAKAKDADLGREVEREFKMLQLRRSFGLSFERHRPENVELLIHDTGFYMGFSWKSEPSFLSP